MALFDCIGGHAKSHREEPYNFLDTEPPKLSGFELRSQMYYELAKMQFEIFVDEGNTVNKRGRCSYCNCKLDSTKTHCASCGAPC